MRNEEKFLQSILTSTKKGDIEWKEIAVPCEASSMFAKSYMITKGINPEFKMFIVKTNFSENPYAFFAILNGKLVMKETSGEIENPYTLSALFLAATTPVQSNSFDIETMLNKIPSENES